MKIGFPLNLGQYVDNLFSVNLNLTNFEALSANLKFYDIKKATRKQIQESSLKICTHQQKN